MAKRKQERLPPYSIQFDRGRLVLGLPARSCLRASPEMFWDLCATNPDLRLERGASGRVIVRPPADGESGARGAESIGQVGLWNRASGLGRGFDSSGGFTLPNGAVIAASLCWIELGRWEAVPRAERQKFARICPDFVAELRCRSDRLPVLKRKMQQYIEQGVRLAWLIDPISRRVEVYRPGHDAEILDRPASLSGEDVLPGFVLDLRGILGD